MRHGGATHQVRAVLTNTTRAVDRTNDSTAPRGKAPISLRLGTIALIVAVLVASGLTWRWLEITGGPTALADRFGPWAPLVSIPTHTLLSSTPFPSELLGVANGSTYGLWLGTLYGWVAWWSGGMIEFALARRSAHNPTTQSAESRLPTWLRRFPAGHPVVMILGRQLPFGFHAVNVMAAISGVTINRQMLLSAISNLIFAFIAAATGAGLVATGLI
jgi:uncharacterized membrane protein YdjX (TVP38/TMEM64 family)